jgi:uncharacterized protein YjdB
MRDRFIFSTALAWISLLAGCSSSPTEQTAPDRPSQTLSVLPETSSLELGASVRLAATVVGTGRPLGTPANVAWQSSDPAIASVDQNGIVRGMGVGQAAIVARWDTITAVAQVSVQLSTKHESPCAAILVSASARHPDECQ